jgi:hypothetical protein
MWLRVPLVDSQGWTEGDKVGREEGGEEAGEDDGGVGSGWAKIKVDDECSGREGQDCSDRGGW